MYTTIVIIIPSVLIHILKCLFVFWLSAQFFHIVRLYQVASRRGLSILINFTYCSLIFSWRTIYTVKYRECKKLVISLTSPIDCIHDKFVLIYFLTSYDQVPSLIIIIMIIIYGIWETTENQSQKENTKVWNYYCRSKKRVHKALHH